MLNFLLIALYSLIVFLLVTPLTQFLTFVAGLALGSTFIYLDRLFLAKWYLEANEKQADIKHYISSSVLFLLAYVAMAIYLVTSGGNRFAQGIVMGLGLTILAQMLEVFKNPSLFKEKFLWQLQLEVKNQGVYKIIIAFVGFLLFLTAKII